MPPDGGRKGLGDKGERIAVAWLRRNGYRILKRNFRCRVGEIDIIAVLRKVLCFVEVKTRRHGEYLSAVESITVLKERKIRRTAEAFLVGFRGAYEECRFEAVAVVYHDDGHYEIEHLKDIF